MGVRVSASEEQKNGSQTLTGVKIRTPRSEGATLGPNRTKEASQSTTPTKRPERSQVGI